MSFGDRVQPGEPSAVWLDMQREKQDARRYRWLREQPPTEGAICAHRRVYDGYHFAIRGRELDIAIDLAMGSEP